MVSVRTVFGVVFSIIGLVLLLYAGFNFNYLFFIQEMSTESDIPAYWRSVAAPAFLALLLLLDGSFVLGLNRAFSLSVHAMGNFVWLLALLLLDRNLAMSTTALSAYQLIFYLVLVGVVLFVVGTIANGIPQRK